MLELILIVMSTSFGGGESAAKATPPAAAAAEVIPSAPAQANPSGASHQQAGVAPVTYAAEPQIPTGKFTTALEVKPILTMTQASWVAVREYGGQDLVYVTHLLAWRCGLLAINFAVNDEAMQPWDLPACHSDTASPNAITESDGLPYKAFPVGSVEKVVIELIYDDLTTERAGFTRFQVLMP